MTSVETRFGSVDLDELHGAVVPARGSGPRGEECAALVGDGRSIGVRLDDGRSWTLTAVDGAISVVPGLHPEPTLVVTSDAESWSELATESWSLMGLAFRGRLRVEQGTFDQLARWEPALQALYTDRPIWSAGAAVGREVPGPPWSFDHDADATDMAAALARNGFLHVRGVFDADEVASMAADVERQREAADPSDKRSWWATDSSGVEQCCRLTYLNHRSEQFAGLADDARLAALAALSPTPLIPTPDHGDGVSVVIKVPEAVEGLADLPWHRDCGMGGHPILCPGLNLGVQLDPANAATGQLHFLPGTNGFAGGDAAEAPQGVVAIDAEPGDVTVHYGHTLHAAPAPGGAERCRRSVYVSFHVPDYTRVISPGQGYNDVLFTEGDGRVRPPTA